MRIRYIFLIISILLSGCFSPKTVEVGQLEGIKINKFQKNTLSIEVLLPINNPNFFRFKITDIDIDVSIRDKELGKITSVDKIIIPGKSDEVHTFFIDLELSNVLLGTIAFINSLSGNKVKLKLDGYIEVRSFLYKKKIIISENQLVTTV